MIQTSRLSSVFDLPHFWSLAVEEQFYLIWPFVLLLAARHGLEKRLCMAVWLFSLLFRVSIFASHLNTGWAWTFLGGRAGELALGALLALWLRGSEQERNRVLRSAKPLLLGSLAGALLGIVLIRSPRAADMWMGTAGIAFFSLAFMALIALCLRPGFFQSFFEVSILRWLGKISYGIYVYHILLRPFFRWIVHQLFPGLTGHRFLIVLAAVALAGTLLAAWLSFRFFESVFLRLKDRLANPNLEHSSCVARSAT